MEENKTFYTEEGYKKLVDELEYLKGPKMKEVKEAIAAARDLGDLSENSEYDEAKNEQTKVVTRIQDIEELLLHAVVINENEVDMNLVHLGSTVKLFDFDFDEEIEYSIVGTNEVDALAGKISDQSPIGSALLGARKGENVTVETPNGNLRFKVLDVWRAKNN
ncbi:MAG: transcription elongation factor GreA [Clostridia bacterium]|nr:transcription elongation factor GreA [Clostridia bacterium]